MRFFGSSSRSGYYDAAIEAKEADNIAELDRRSSVKNVEARRWLINEQVVVNMHRDNGYKLRRTSGNSAGIYMSFKNVYICHNDLKRHINVAKNSSN